MPQTVIRRLQNFMSGFLPGFQSVQVSMRPRINTYIFHETRLSCSAHGGATKTTTLAMTYIPGARNRAHIPLLCFASQQGEG